MWDIFKDWIFQIISFFYNLCGDWGVAIIIVTLIFRILLLPLVQKQTKSTYMMQKMQPQMAAIQKKYADDPQRQQQEMQKLYAEAKFNPLSGCIPLLLQMPIFIALFQVLREMGDRVDGSYEFLNIVPNLVMTPQQAFEQGFNVFIPYLVLMIIFAGATFLPMLLQNKDNKDEKQKKQTYIMSAFMSVFMLFISWTSPAGVLLFWGTSSLFGLAQQQITLSLLRKKDANEEEIIDVKPVEVDVVRKEKKPRPKKKS